MDMLLIHSRSRRLDHSPPPDPTSIISAEHPSTVKNSFPNGKFTCIKFNCGEPLSLNGDKVCPKFNKLSVKYSRDSKPRGADHHNGSRLRSCFSLWLLRATAPSGIWSMSSLSTHL